MVPTRKMVLLGAAALLVAAFLVARWSGRQDEDRLVTAVTGRTFAREVETSPLPVVVDFWAAWCAPCRAVAPVMAALAASHEGRVKFCKVDVDRNPDLARRFRVEALPTVLLFREGKVTDLRVGARSRAEYDAWLAGHGVPAPDGGGGL